MYVKFTLHKPNIYIAYFFTKLEMRVLFPPWEGQPLPLLWKEAPKVSGPPQARGASYTEIVHDGRTWFNNLPEGHMNARLSIPLPDCS